MVATLAENFCKLDTYHLLGHAYPSDSLVKPRVFFFHPVRVMIAIGHADRFTLIHSQTCIILTI